MKDVTLTRRFRFEAAHRLPNLPEGHKCRRLHGHSFRVELELRGPIGADTGWFMDYGDIKAAFSPLFDQLDHRYLNEVPGLENPTSENLAVWIWDRLVGSLAGLQAVAVMETETTRAVYRGEPTRAGGAHA